MNGKDVSKKVYVTLADTVQENLENWADYQGRPTANLAAYLIELGIREAKERGEFKVAQKTAPVAESKGN